MKIEFKKDYILVTSRHLVYLFGFFSGTPKLARAASFFPFIFVRSEDIIEPWLMWVKMNRGILEAAA